MSTGTRNVAPLCGDVFSNKNNQREMSTEHEDVNTVPTGGVDQVLWVCLLLGEICVMLVHMLQVYTVEQQKIRVC